MQGCGDGVLAGVTAGVVDTQRCVGGQFEGESHFPLVESAGLFSPVEAYQPQHGAAQSQGRGEERADAGCADGLGACGVGYQPGRVGIQADEAGFEIGQGPGVGGRERQAAHVTHRMCLNLLLAAAMAEGGTAQRHIPPQGAERGFLTAQYSIHHFHHRDVRKARHHGLHQLLTVGHHIEASAHPLPHSSEDPEPGARLFVFGDISHSRGNPKDRPPRVLQTESRDQDRAASSRGVLGLHTHHKPRRGDSALQHPTQHGLHLVRGGQSVNISKAALHDSFGGHAAHDVRRIVGRYDPQLLVQDVHPYRCVGEQCLQRRRPHVRSGSLLRRRLENGPDHRPVTSRQGPYAQVGVNGVAVPVLECHTSALVCPVPGTRRGPVDQVGCRPPDHLIRRPPQQFLRFVAPPDNHPLGVHDHERGIACHNNHLHHLQPDVSGVRLRPLKRRCGVRRSRNWSVPASPLEALTVAAA